MAAPRAGSRKPRVKLSRPAASRLMRAPMPNMATKNRIAAANQNRIASTGFTFPLAVISKLPLTSGVPMAYARLTENGSEVYVIDHVGGYLCCMWCRLTPDGGNFTTPDVAAMCAHLAGHRW